MESKYAVMNIITVVVAVTWCSLFHTINVAYKYLGMLVMHLHVQSLSSSTELTCRPDYRKLHVGFLSTNHL